MKRRLLLALLCSACACSDLARAQVIHRTQSGDTLGGLADRYYGDAGLADLIARHNGIRGAFKPGIELRLPSASQHEVARGESWNDLAARYWGEASSGQALARWCGSDGATSPTQGQVLTIPALVKHRLEPGETLVALARAFYRDPEKAGDIGRLNRIDDPKRLRAGTALRLPFFAIVRPELASRAASKPASSPSAPASAAASSASSRASSPPEDVAAAPMRRDDALSMDLSGAVNAYLDGNFEDALARLEAQRVRVLASGSQDQRGLLLRYLIFSYVAFDRNDAACDAFAALRKSGDDAALDPELVSPKIRGVLGQCGVD